MKFCKRHTFSIAALLLLFSLSGMAGTIRFHQRLQDSIAVGGKDTLITEVTPKTGSFKDIRVSDLITVGIDPDYIKYVIDSSVYVISLNIDGYDASNNLISTTTHTFTITHDPLRKGAYRDQDLFKFDGAYKYRITFTGATQNGLPVTSLPDYIYIDGDIEVERYYVFSSWATTTMSTSKLAKDLDCNIFTVEELDVSWNSCFGTGLSQVCPESYELEWTFVNDYDSVVGLYKNPSLLNYDFRNNSTRVSTTDNHYRLSLIYEHGYIVYRVRAIGKDTASPNNTIVGVWNLSNSGTISSLSSSNFYYNTAPHEFDKNWQYNASFAEEGKKKEVVSYFDGSLRNRQSVTKMNSDRNLLVGETIYDFQGRPAVNVLPVPIDMPTCYDDASGALQFYVNFNQDDSTFAYSRNDFDVDNGNCQVSPGPMSTVSGASHYYSPANPNMDAQQKFLPDAKKYPFTQVEYTPDNTGRIKRQGGVGIHHQLNTKHETTYFYGQPTQIELDRLFGSEVGDATHYKKNVVIDANEQSSITYLDQEGRTIATALAGDTANGLAKIASNQAPILLKADLFNKDANGISKLDTVNAAGNAIEFGTQLLVAYQSPYKFAYALQIDTMPDSCLANAVCFSCVYDLEMHVYNDCGEDLLANHYGGIPLKKTIGHFTYDVNNNLVFNTSCTGPTLLTELDTFTLVLDPGNYTVSKVLKVNQQAINYYVAQYLDTTKNTCVKSLSDFVQGALANVDTSGCHITCESCLASLGDRDAWVANGKGTYLEYDALADACLEPCREKSDCYIRYLQMLADISPGGQYGEYLNSSGLNDPAAFPLSVFNDNNSLPKNVGTGTGNWHFPEVVLNNTTYNEYVDEQGNISRIDLIKNGTVYSPAVLDTISINGPIKYDTATASYYTSPANLANFSDFLYAWQPSWAKSIVKYHPEYCYYENCSGFGKIASGEFTTSDAFDALLQTTTSFSLAVQRGLIKSNYVTLNYKDRLADYEVISSSSLYDPFLTNATYGSYGTTLKSLLNTNYLPRPVTNIALSMVEAAAFYARCGTIYGNQDTSGCLSFGATAPDSIKNAEWQTFVGFYLSNKQKLQQQYLDAQVKGSGCPGYNGCIGDSNNVYNGAVSLGGQYTNSQQPCGISTFYLYADKIRRFGGASSVLPTTVNAVTYQVYTATGQCPNAGKLQNLLGQLAGNKKLETAVSVDLQTYSSLAPELYNALGGSTNTGPYQNFYWNSSYTGGLINAAFKNSSNNTVCTLSLDLTSSGITSLNGYDVVAVSGLSDTSLTGPNAFRVFLALKDTITDSVIYKMALGNSSCFGLTDCKFQQVCQPNDFAGDLQKLMTALATNNHLLSSNRSLYDGTYYTYVSAALKNSLGTTTSNKLIWNFSSTKFELYDSLVPSVKLLITPSTTVNLGSAHHFNNINSTGFNFFNITAYNSSNSVIGGYNGNAIRRTIVGTDTTLLGISLGTCDFPTPSECNGNEFKVSAQLEKLLSDVLVNMPANHNVDLTKYPGYTYFLQTYLPTGLSTTSSTLIAHAPGLPPMNNEQLLFTVKSSTDSCYFNLNADTTLAFDSIIAFTDLTGYDITDANGNYHKFFGIAKYSKSGTLFTDTIFGESCLPLLNCAHCEPSAGVLDTCNTLYQNYVSAVNTFNATNYGGLHPVIIFDNHFDATVPPVFFSNPAPLISYADAQASGYCVCLDDYAAYVYTFDTTSGNMPVPIMNYTLCTVRGVMNEPCRAAFNQDTTVIRQYNNYVTANSIPLPLISLTKYQFASFTTNGFCLCVSSYVAFLRSITTGVTQPADVDTSLLDIANYCPEPCKPYVYPDTASGQVFPTTFGVVPPEDTSCVQYALNLAMQNGMNQYKNYKDSLTTIIADKYVKHCLGAFEEFTDKYLYKEYHFTLYYYDQAGNLIRTVPPEGFVSTGVEEPPGVPIITPQNAADSICYDRTFNKRLFFTQHRLPTTYLYNSLNQLVKQSMPDHDPVDVWEYTLPNGLHPNLKVTGVQFVNENVGYLSGYIDLPATIEPGINKRGHLYTTDNGGKNWRMMEDVAATYLNKVQMVTIHTGYAVGKDGIVLKTVDKGFTWDIIPTYHEYTNGWGIAPEWNDLYFADSLKGVIVGSEGKSLLFDLSQSIPDYRIKTVSLPTADKFTGVTFDANSGNVYASAHGTDGFGKIYVSNLNPFTTDSLKWDLVSGIAANDLLDVEFTPSNSNTGFASGISGTILKTSDAGSHWEQVNTGLGSDVRSIFFRNDSVGVALVDSSYQKSKLYKTSNGGKTWSLVSQPGKHFTDLAYYPSSNTTTTDKAFAVGNNGLVTRIVANTNNISPNFGSSPYFGLGIVNSPTDKTDFKCVAAATYTTTVAKPKIIMGAANGKVYFSQKADSSVVVWDSLIVNTVPVPLKKIAMKLTGAGNTIQAVAIDTNGILYGVDVATQTISSYTVSPINFIDIKYHSGSSAFYGYNNADQKVYKITFSTGLTPSVLINILPQVSGMGTAKASAFTGNSLMVVGKDGEIFKDSLVTTTPIWVDQSNNLKLLPLNDIQTDFHSTPALYAVGNNGTLLQKRPGFSWKKIATTANVSLNSIKFFNRTIGIIAGDKAKLVSVAVNVSSNYTVALSNVSVPAGVTDNLNDVVAPGSAKVYAVGNNGLVLSMNNIGVLSALKISMGTSTRRLNGAGLWYDGSLLAVGEDNSIYNVNTNAILRVSGIFTPAIKRGHFINASNGYLVGENGLIRYTPDGVAWKVVLPGLSNTSLDTFNTVYAYKPGQALIAGKQGYLANVLGKSTPANITTGLSVGLNDINFGGNSPNLGFIVGDNKTIGQIDVSTLVFNSLILPALPLPASYNLHALHVFQDNSLMAVGSKGAVLFYNAFYNTWHKHGVPHPPGNADSTRYSFNDVYFHDDRNGYVVGDSGVVLRWNSNLNLQQLTGNTQYFNSFFKPRPTEDLLGVTDSTRINISSVACQDRYHGFLGGAYPDSINNAKYARLFHDETQLFSTFFWYDKLGRMVVSQNSKQYAKTPKAYSYTKYDALGRITEVGEKPENIAAGNTRFANVTGQIINGRNYHIVNEDSLNAWIGYGLRKEVTHTFYDTVAVDSIPIDQQNLRKRISTVTYEDIDDGNPESYQHATHFSYDIHGNVKTLVQDNPSVAVFKQQFKKVDYDYDMISGKVNKVHYEKDSLDQFTHKYEYDADNRLTDVFTSHDGLIWDKDAKYFYYAHGPLARVEYGNNHVQGMDYAYTIQGWIKGVNSENLQAANDMGHDGFPTPGNPNAKFAKDAFGYSLTYNRYDYQAIDPAWTSDSAHRFAASQFFAPGDPSDLIHYRHDLYNGNIGSMVSSFTNPQLKVGQALGNSYKYDQLNRLIQASSFDQLISSANIWNNENFYYPWASIANLNKFSYDANGNILSQLRQDERGRTFDSLTYRYKKDALGRTIQNRLYHVNDTIPASVMNDDVDDEGAFTANENTINQANNYSYDRIGNLVKDSAEGIVTIDWTVYGKIKKITHRTGFYKLTGTDTVRPPDMEFHYDASGQRISKIVKPRTATGVKPATEWTGNYYIRDKPGNILSSYKQHDSTAISAMYFTQTEKHIYGSSRIGMDLTNRELIGATASGDTSSHYLGNKQFELSNHLGNVIVTVSDKKVPQDPTAPFTIYNNPDVVRTGIDSLGGMKIRPLTTFAGVNFVFPSTIGQVYKIDFYYNQANTDPNVLTGDDPRFAYEIAPGVYANILLPSSGHYSVTTVATATTVTFKPLYNAGNHVPAHYFLFDSLKIVAVGSLMDTIQTSTADVISISDVSSFGAPLHDRQWQSSRVSVGFNGKQKDSEIYGEGNAYDYGFRENDTRLGRFWGVDPLFRQYPELTSYQFASNSPIMGTDMDGRELRWVFDYNYYVIKGIFGDNAMKNTTGGQIVEGMHEQFGAINQNFRTAKTVENIGKIAADRFSTPGGTTKALTGVAIFEDGAKMTQGLITEGKEVLEGIAQGGNAKPYVQGLRLMGDIYLFGDIMSENVSTQTEAIDIQLKMKENWTAEQKAQAIEKTEELTKSKTIVTENYTRAPNTRGRFVKAGGKVEKNQDVDHVIELQLGGSNDLSNLKAIDKSVNRSIGKQINNWIKNLPAGTKIGEVKIK